MTNETDDPLFTRRECLHASASPGASAALRPGGIRIVVGFRLAARSGPPMDLRVTPV
ncbi:hypothetical protein WMF37_05565 [Sorangium sp. So ce291]|uniref:hypothetical protein n=1 Tax=Sorangium sp. So ce291 TaxID=3133294 RepID=UPI003F6381CF